MAKYIEQYKAEIQAYESAKIKAENAVFKYAVITRMLFNRLKFMVSKIDDCKSTLFLKIKESGLYENFDDEINDVIFRIDYLRETLKGVIDSEIGKDIIKLIDTPAFNHKINKLKEIIDNEV